MGYTRCCQCFWSGLPGALKVLIVAVLCAITGTALAVLLVILDGAMCRGAIERLRAFYRRHFHPHQNGVI